jgi:hypothetical protein
MEHVRVINDCQLITLSQEITPSSVFYALAVMPIEGMLNGPTMTFYDTCYDGMKITSSRESSLGAVVALARSIERRVFTTITLRGPDGSR